MRQVQFRQIEFPMPLAQRKKKIFFANELKALYLLRATGIHCRSSIDEQALSNFISSRNPAEHNDKYDAIVENRNNMHISDTRIRLIRPVIASSGFPIFRPSCSPGRSFFAPLPSSPVTHVQRENILTYKKERNDMKFLSYKKPKEIPNYFLKNI